MIKSFLLIILFLFGITLNLFAQASPNKSSYRKARADVMRFKLNKADYKAFLKHRENQKSDYFKPVAGMVRDTALLRDSAYVSRFRSLAYAKTKSRPLNTAIIVGGGFVIVAAVVIIGVLLSELGGEYK